MTRNAEFIFALIKKYYETWKRPLPGKKALQKLAYFAQAEGAPISFSFHLHKYGPYSPEMEDVLADLRFFEKIEIRATGFDRETEIFPLSVGEEKFEYLSPEDLAVAEAVVSKYGEFSPQYLELLATVHLIARDQWVFGNRHDREDIIATAWWTKKPKFSRDEVERAYEKLKELGALPGSRV
ncbi:type II toxin-antitoxin system antitoxin SocA domain-containing protein [Ammonifex thiophilus]|uniref:DUF4065 domain-containing protein n=1 Tax=Ammonifex thiophilus TaxID=444093 RepID=A0A3D8P6G1_9THEO|nr:type II toxin-antitoxin system antitoxin SocA domain-containing protein [Ammonifex thiophilus]RDV83900.1 DUF4065 domain-containing protein [Ammonifex thiophilus]